MYENKEVCAECGGECCKVFPGLCLPGDFGKPADRRGRITDALRTGKYCLERHLGDPRSRRWCVANSDSMVEEVLYVRPAVVGSEGRLVDSIHFDEATCTFHNGLIGCELLPKARPYECRVWEPRGNPERCIRHGLKMKKDVVIRWIPYQQMLREIVASIQADLAQLM